MKVMQQWCNISSSSSAPQDSFQNRLLEFLLMSYDESQELRTSASFPDRGCKKSLFTPRFGSFPVSPLQSPAVT